MDCSFAQFCSCSTAGYAALLEHVDACAASGYNYEFHPCRMPSGCTPTESTLGFGRFGDGYLLYLRPTVYYAGENPFLRHFFSQTCWYFPDFSALSSALSELNTSLSDAALPPLCQSLLTAFHTRIMGQAEALEAVAFKLYGHISKQTPRRPLSLIFYGPTGVGKSELAKNIAPTLNQCCPQAEWQTVWTELNTFTEAHSAYRLTGAPPGYVGYDDPSILEAARRAPHTVFVFDELEKAHPTVLKIFMSILDEGRCTARRADEQGSRELDFRHCIFVFTSNADLSSPERPLGFAPSQEGSAPCTPSPTAPAHTLAQRLFLRDETARQALTRSGVLREIAGRFSGLIAFQPLDAQARTAVTAHQIAALGREHGLTIVEVAPELAARLTPDKALSPRSTLGILEGLFTPLFAAYAAQVPQKAALRLTGTAEAPMLQPI